jgi:hypothetical protein
VQMSTHEHTNSTNMQTNSHVTIYDRAMAHGLSHHLRRPGFSYRLIYVEFEEGKVKVNQVPLTYFGFSSSSLHQCSATIHQSVTEAVYFRNWKHIFNTSFSLKNTSNVKHDVYEQQT